MDSGILPSEHILDIKPRFKRWSGLWMCQGRCECTFGKTVEEAHALWKHIMKEHQSHILPWQVQSSLKGVH